MRVAYAMINCNRRDGSARPVNEVAERLARRGHEISLFARKAEDLDLGLVRWQRVPGPGWPEVADFSTYHWLANRMIHPADFDIIHSVGCNTLRANVVTIQNIQPAKEEILKIFSAGERVSLPRRLTRWLYQRRTAAAERALYNREGGREPLLFLPVSRGVEAELRRFYRIGDSRVRIIPNAADPRKFRPLPAGERLEWRRSHGIGEEEFVAVFSGGEWARKGLDLAIGALEFPEAAAVRLFVAGDDPDRERFFEMAGGARGRVIFGGFRRDIEQVLGACDVFIFPSHYEAFSLAMIEAAACGLPVLTAKINGAEDFIIEGVNGRLLPHDSQAIARALGDLVKNRETARRMGEAGRHLVEKHYTWDAVADATEAAYIEFLEWRQSQSGR